MQIIDKHLQKKKKKLSGRYFPLAEKQVVLQFKTRFFLLFPGVKEKIFLH